MTSLGIKQMAQSPIDAEVSFDAMSALLACLVLLQYLNYSTGQPQCDGTA
jgi:hypothetical protein